MRRRYVLLVLVGLVAVAGVVYLAATRTYWADAKVPLPPKGEALTNPFYAAQRFVDALGARASRDRLFTPPSSGAVIVLSRWNWNLSTRRREAIERWVESGGRLVVDDTISGSEEFTEWSGLEYQQHEKLLPPPADGHCARFREEQAMPAVPPVVPTHWLCDFDRTTFLSSSRQVQQWALFDPTYGRQAIRVSVGRGSVTLVNWQPFQYRALFDGDHPWVLVKAAELKRGDEVHFLSEADHPSLLSLVWLYGAPVLWLGLTALGLLLWRGGIRFGPLAPPEGLLRRSLAEQIRGTGRFAFQHDHGESLHTATVRAVEEAARRRVVGYAALAPRDRVAALAEAGGMPATDLAEALDYHGLRRPSEVRGAISRLETIRRAILGRPARTMHGTE